MSNNINESKGIEKDEKLCPMCGETIKLIAIKCKYCESILCDRTEDDAVEDVYYYRYGSSKQTETGPFTYEEIKDLYAKDKISSSVFISKNNSNDWDVITNYLVHNGNEPIKKLNQEVSSNKSEIGLILEKIGIFISAVAVVDFLCVVIGSKMVNLNDFDSHIPLIYRILSEGFIPRISIFSNSAVDFTDFALGAIGYFAFYLPGKICQSD